MRGRRPEGAALCGQGGQSRHGDKQLHNLSTITIFEDRQRDLVSGQSITGLGVNDGPEKKMKWIVIDKHRRMPCILKENRGYQSERKVSHCFSAIRYREASHKLFGDTSNHIITYDRRQVVVDLITLPAFM